MSDIQKILTAIADEMHNKTITEYGIRRIVATLNGVQPYYHNDAVKAALCVKEDEDA